MNDKAVERWSGFKVWLFSLFTRDSERGRIAVDRMQLTPGDRFLDIGCGLGGALEHALRSGASVAGIDPSPAMVERARRRVPEAEVREGSAEGIPFPDGSFIAVLSLASYHHWADPGAGLDEAARVLAPGGRLLIAEKLLAKGKGHGLSREDADRLILELSKRGFDSGKIEEVQFGRHHTVAISAYKTL